jgi:hypothetical protein
MCFGVFRIYGYGSLIAPRRFGWTLLQIESIAQIVVRVRAYSHQSVKLADGVTEEAGRRDIGGRQPNRYS